MYSADDVATSMNASFVGGIDFVLTACERTEFEFKRFIFAASNMLQNIVEWPNGVSPSVIQFPND